MKASPREIEVIGADANNLADITVGIPRDAVTAIVGPSGSGKSSLVEDTIAAEAADRMRRFLQVDLGTAGNTTVRAYVGELPPTLFAGQRAFRASSRTTVGTSTGLLRVLRRLFVRHSRPFADKLGPVPDPSPESFAAWLVRYMNGRAIMWAVPVRNQATTGAAAVKRLLEAGLAQAIIRSETDSGARAEKGREIQLSRFKPLAANVRHTIEARIGEVRLAAASRAKLQELLEQAWMAADGGVFVELPDTDRNELRGAFAFGLDARVHRVHPGTPVVYAAADPNRLSFNAPSHAESGACDTCRGTGTAAILDEEALVAHPERSMHEGALALWTTKNYKYVNIQHSTIEGLRGRQGFNPDTAWSKLPSSARALIFDGSTEPVEDRDPKTGKKASAPHNFSGFRQAILEKAGRPTPAGEALRAYVRGGPCSACGGTRWSFQARALRVADWSIDRLLALPLSRFATETHAGSLAKQCPAEARHLVANLHRMATALVSVGLGHLSGDRGMLDVSDGESRRLRLAAVLTSRLAGLLLVLDEPARGLHEEDLSPLGDAILEASRTHTVLISEHRQRLVARAHHLIELGPGAGPDGGRVTYTGPVEESAWLRPHSAARSRTAAPVSPSAWLEIDGVRIHNVADAHVRLPLGAITCIAGVSGSGKSSFVRGALVPALAGALPTSAVEIKDFRTREGTWRRLQGAGAITSLHALDQAASTTQRRSLIATFLDFAEGLREAFAADPAARKLGLSPRDFSTNTGRGRCQRCLGVGTLEDGGECPVCGGLRFGIDALSVRVSGLNLADLLAEPIEALLERASPLISPAILRTLIELGVGYLSLGRSLDTLSGGEIQRLRIARALVQQRSEGAFFVLDEPAGGLHPRDVERLEQALRHIVANGANTVVLVEHDPHLLAVCDHIVEFGPGGGPEGGHVISQGTPAQVRQEDTPTGRALRARLRSAHPSRATDRQDAPVATERTVAERARAEIRQILGDDVEVPDDDGAVVRPSALPGRRDLAERPHELADLDLSLLQVLLDSLPGTAPDDLHALAKAWHGNPELHLQIHPLLDAIAVWGEHVPRSVVDETNEHLAAMGIGPPLPRNVDVRRVRASGPRFTPPQPSFDGYLTAIRDAWTLGGGYLELVDSAERVPFHAQERLLDLDAALCGPRHPAPGHFRRFDSRGACPMCRGTGEVTAVDRTLIVRNRSLKVLDEGSLDPRAAAVLKGVRRSDMEPFFRRLAEEGLWNDGARWSSLDTRGEATVMHGFWIRPGHGTFVKAGKDIDGSEVKHWLRWDGLIAATFDQAHRSKDSAWRDALHASRQPVTCPSCEGSGLGPASALIKLDGKPFDRWIRERSLGQLLDSIVSLQRLSRRATRTRQRLMKCFEPLRASNPPLRHAVSGPEAREVVKRAVKAFTGMALIEEEA